MGIQPTDEASHTSSSVDSPTHPTATGASDHLEQPYSSPSEAGVAPHVPVRLDDTAIDEKSARAKEENGSVTTTALPIAEGKVDTTQASHVEKSEGDNHVEGQEEEDDDHMVYPKGLPLALLTFGLCIANLAIALG
jgi:hypothetical protein